MKAKKFLAALDWRFKRRFAALIKFNELVSFKSGKKLQLLKKRKGLSMAEKEEKDF